MPDDELAFKDGSLIEYIKPNPVATVFGYKDNIGEDDD